MSWLVIKCKEAPYGSVYASVDEVVWDEANTKEEAKAIADEANMIYIDWDLIHFYTISKADWENLNERL